MASINIIIADSDSRYLRRLVNNLMEINKQINISSFSEKGSFIKYLTEKNNHFHILLFSEDMYSEEIDRHRIDLKMVLADGNVSFDGKYKALNKYRRAEELLNEVLVEYSDKTGSVENLSATENGTRVIGVYSPVGGSGKTTLALMTAMALSSAGRKVLYLNFEGVSSVGEIFKGISTHSMSEVFLAAKTKKANVGLKVIQCRETHYDTGIDFINAPECAAEYSEMTSKELKRIAEETKAIGQYDDIVVDMNSGYNDDIFEVLNVCQVILTPFRDNKASFNKMECFADELEKIQKLETIGKKLILIENCSPSISRESFGGLSVQVCIQENAVLRNIDNIFYGDSKDAASKIMSILL